MTDNIEILIGAKDKFSKAFTSSIGVLAKGAGIVAAAVGGWTAATIANTKAVADNYDKVQKLSDQLGVSTEFLSKYAVAADFSGVQTETFNKSIQMLQVRIGEANRGIGMGKDTFDQLKVSVYNANGTLKTSEEILPELADRFHNMASATERAEAASKIFGQRGISMLQIFKDGREGLDKMTAEAEKFGLVISSKAGANAAEFNDSLTRVSGSIKGLRNYFAESFFPVMTVLSNKFADLVAENRPAIIGFAQDVSVAMATMAETGLVAIGKLMDGWRGLQTVYQRVRAQMLQAEAAWVEAQIELRERAIKGRQKGLDPETDLLIERNEKALYRLYEQLRDIKGGAAEAFTIIAEIAEQKTNVQSIKDLISGLKDSFNELNSSTASSGNQKNVLSDYIDLAKMTPEVQQSFEALKQMRNEYMMSERERLDEWYKEQKELYGTHKKALFMLDEVYQAKIDEINEAEKAKLDSHLENLKEIYNSYRMSDLEKLDEWYAEQRDLFSGHNEALYMLDEVYTQRRLDLAAYENEYRKRLRQEDLNNYATFAGNLASVAQSFGKKGFELFKVAQIAEATIAGYAAAVKAWDAGMETGKGPYAPIVAAAFMAASLAATTAKIVGISQQEYPSAHGGLDYVPKEQTYLLDRGERVLSPSQNRDLTDALSGGGLGGNIQIDNLYLDLSGVVSAESLTDLTVDDWIRIGQERVLPAMQKLSNQGFKVDNA